MLAKKKTDFATMWLTTGIKSRSHGIKMINVAQISQYSALILVAKKSHGIYKPEDLNGKKISLWGGDFLLQPNAFFKKYNLKVTVIPQLDNINLFLQDGVDAAAAMWFNEVHTLYAVGYDPDQITTFFFSKYGLNFPEDGMYVLEETYKKDPEMVRNFIKASFEGWLYAFQHKDEALDILLEYIRKANIPVNRMHEKWMLEKMQDWILPHDQETQLGYLRPKDFKLVSETLKENKLIETIPKYNEFFIDCYNEKK
jgi:NitT/TauT family transport system substrate-binding protein